MYEIITKKKYNMPLLVLIDSQTGRPQPEVEDYCHHMHMMNYSPNTIETSVRAIGYFMNFLCEYGFELKKVPEYSYIRQDEIFRQFLLWLELGEHHKLKVRPNSHTCKQYLSPVFQLYQHMAIDGTVPPLKVVEQCGITVQTMYGGTRVTKGNRFFGFISSPVEHDVIEQLKDSDITTILSECHNLRDECFIQLLIDTGLRISEARGIKQQDLDLENGTISVVFRTDNLNNARAKYGENRTLPISNQLVEMFTDYLTCFAEILCRTEYLFISISGRTMGQPLSMSGAEAIIDRIARRLKREFTSRSFRHYFATSLYENTVSLETIQHALGHRLIITTIGYIDVDDKKMRKALREYFATHHRNNEKYEHILEDRR